VDEPLHPRVPAAGLVSEVDTRFQQLSHSHDGHVVVSFPSVLLVPSLRPEATVGGWGCFCRVLHSVCRPGLECTRGQPGSDSQHQAGGNVCSSGFEQLHGRYLGDGTQPEALPTEPIQ